MVVPVVSGPGEQQYDPELQDIEMRHLLSAVYEYYGYDFRQYAPASMKRRVLMGLQREGLRTISALQDRILHDAAACERFLEALTINVSSMFRDPGFFLAFRRDVVPILRTFPVFRIWCAGCSTGEEVYSLAILLQEEGLLDRSIIYATDMQETVVRKARDGIFPLASMQDYTFNYQASGGTQTLSDYYTAAYGNAMMHPSLRRKTVFSRHNLTTDASFNEFQVILCRNTMIYFQKPLQDRVHELIYGSLAHWGVLGLGRSETLRFTPHEQQYRELNSREKIYQRVA